MSNNSTLPIIAVGALGLSSVSCVISSLTGFLVSGDSNVESNTSTSNTNTDTSNTSTDTSNTSTDTSNTSTETSKTIPHQISSGADGWCIGTDSVHQDVPGCGRICSSAINVGSKQDGTWGPWADTTIACTGAKLDEIWEVQDDGTRKLADGYIVSKIPDGTSVQCTTNDLRGRDGSVYRVNSDGILDYYPTPSIAETWNPDWSVGIIQIADCTGLTKGKDLGYAPGTSVKCKKNDLRGRDGSVYRVINSNQINYYPNPTIATSWNPQYGEDVKMIEDCEGYTKGPNMEMKT